jgi:hypothetical protein
VLKEQEHGVLPQKQPERKRFARAAAAWAATLAWALLAGCDAEGPRASQLPATYQGQFMAPPSDPLDGFLAYAYREWFDAQVVLAPYDPASPKKTLQRLDPQLVSAALAPALERMAKRMLGGTAGGRHHAVSIETGGQVYCFVHIPPEHEPGAAAERFPALRINPRMALANELGHCDLAFRAAQSHAARAPFNPFGSGVLNLGAETPSAYERYLIEVYADLMAAMVLMKAGGDAHTVRALVRARDAGLLVYRDTTHWSARALEALLDARGALPLRGMDYEAMSRHARALIRAREGVLTQAEFAGLQALVKGATTLADVRAWSKQSLAYPPAVQRGLSAPAFLTTRDRIAQTLGER